MRRTRWLGSLLLLVLTAVPCSQSVWLNADVSNGAASAQSQGVVEPRRSLEEAERRRLEAERQKLIEEKATVAERQRVEAERRELEAERQKLSEEQQEFDRQRAELAARRQGEARRAVNINFGTYHALVIGNQNYRQIAKLRTPVGDITAVGEALRQDYGFKVTVLKDATRDAMLTALDGLRHTLGPTDNLLIYYAGHGVLDKGSDRGFWLGVDAESNTRRGWLSNADITDTLKALQAKHVVIVADSCYSGTLLRDVVTTLDRADLVSLAHKKARTALTSGGLEPVVDGGGGPHSAFANAFLTVLRGNSGVADLTTLFASIRSQVSMKATQTPEYSIIREAGHEGGDFLFVRRR